jgi:hypothetical protein
MKKTGNILGLGITQIYRRSSHQDISSDKAAVFWALPPILSNSGPVYSRPDFRKHLTSDYPEIEVLKSGIYSHWLEATTIRNKYWNFLIREVFPPVRQPIYCMVDQAILTRRSSSRFGGRACHQG